MKRIETLADLDALDLARSEQDRQALLAWARASLRPPPQDSVRTVVGDIDGVLRQLREEIH